jgi:hypothetical protein
MDQIVSERIQAGDETYSENHKLINSLWNKTEFPQQWKFARRLIKQTTVIIKPVANFI